MKSAGNDIVAFKITDPQRTNQPRFYRKILSPAEESLFDPGRPGLSFEQYVWLLWSVKESVYKYHRRLDPVLLFSPTKINVQRLTRMGEEMNDLGVRYCAVACWESRLLYARSAVCSDYIATVISEDEQFEGVCWGVGCIRDAASPGHARQSAAVRALLLDAWRPLLGKNLQIQKNTAGIPILMDGLLETGIPISLAHHGSFVAYSLSFPGFAG